MWNATCDRFVTPVAKRGAARRERTRSRHSAWCLELLGKSEDLDLRVSMETMLVHCDAVSGTLLSCCHLNLSRIGGAVSCLTACDV